jgi:hypothetical protein
VTLAKVLVTVLGAVAAVWVLWYFLAPVAPPPERTGGPGR